MKRIFTTILSLIVLFTFSTTALVPHEAFAATKTVAKKTTKKKKTVKKKVVNLDPPIITLDNAPHSPKPVAKKKVTPKKKTVTKKKS